MKKPTLFHEGRKARNLTPEEQAKHRDSVWRRLKVLCEERRKKLDQQSSFLERELKDRQEELENSGQFTELQHRQGLMHGVMLLIPAILGLLGESSLVWWTVSIFNLGHGESLIAASFLIFGFLALESYLFSIEKNFPNLYQKFMLYASFAALVSFLVGLVLLAGLRGEIFTTQQQLALSDSLQSEIDRAKEFYDSIGKNIGWLVIFLSIVGFLSCGISLHQASKRIIVSSPTLRRFKRIRKLRRQLATLGSQRAECEHLPEKGIEEFERGLLSEEDTTRRNWEAILVSPQSIILIVILVILFIALSRGTAKGASDESVCVLLDLSKSSLSENYKGEQEFQKNLYLVQALIRQLNTGTHFMVIGITERSFSAPYIIIDTKMPTDKGFFNEKLAKAKLELLDSWNKLDLKPIAQSTDVFGAINLAASLLGETPARKRLIILSDMRECLRFNFEKRTKIDLQILSQVDKQGLIPSLKGVQVHVLGVHTSGRTEAYWNNLKAFWMEFFEKTGASLLSYSIDRRFQYE